MSVKISYDNGLTWPAGKTIYEGPSAYSCLTVMPDGDIGLLYENGEESPYEKITFVKFPLDWITNKK
jgi:sialidase-1